MAEAEGEHEMGPEVQRREGERREERGGTGDLTGLDVPFCTLPLPGC